MLAQERAQAQLSHAVVGLGRSAVGRVYTQASPRLTVSLTYSDVGNLYMQDRRVLLVGTQSREGENRLSHTLGINRTLSRKQGLQS